jgi:hypothetical protein
MPPKRLTPDARKRWSPGSSPAGGGGLALRDSSNTPRQVYAKPTVAVPSQFFMPVIQYCTALYIRDHYWCLNLVLNLVLKVKK